MSALILLLELTVLFFSVAFLVQLLQRRIGNDRLRTWMGGKPLIAALKGIAIGFVTPFCTYSAVPMLVGMRQAGVSPAGYVAFIMAAPVLDPVLFGALVIIVGLKAAIVYLLVAFIAALSLALLANSIDISAQLKPIHMNTTAEGCASENNGRWQGLAQEVPIAAYAAFSLLKSIWLLLLVGVLAGVAITTIHYYWLG